MSQHLFVARAVAASCAFTTGSRSARQGRGQGWDLAGSWGGLWVMMVVHRRAALGRAEVAGW